MTSVAPQTVTSLAQPPFAPKPAAIAQEIAQEIAPLTPTVTTHWQPAVEMQETVDCIDIQMQLPGFERDDVEVQAFATAIAVRGAHFPAPSTCQSDILMSEFCYGSFERILQLPEAIAIDQVQAELRCGLLTIRLVKAATT